MKGLAERQRGQDVEKGSSEQTKTEGGDDKIRHNYDYFARYGEVGSPFDAQITEETEEDLMETNGVSGIEFTECFVREYVIILINVIIVFSLINCYKFTIYFIYNAHI